MKSVVYVSFMEAVKASKDGKVVWFVDGNESISINLTEPIKDTVLGRYSINELLKGKYTINKF